MYMEESYKERVGERVHAFLDTMAAGDTFTMEQIVTVLWPEIDEATARQRATVLDDELRKVGLGVGSPGHRVPHEKSRGALADALATGVVAFAERNPHEELEIVAVEAHEQLEALRRFGLIWSWTDGETESECDEDDLSPSEQPELVTVRLTRFDIHYLVQLMKADDQGVRVYRDLLRELMLETR